MKQQNQNKHDITAYITMAIDVMFTKISSKVGINKFEEQDIVDMLK